MNEDIEPPNMAKIKRLNKQVLIRVMPAGNEFFIPISFSQNEIILCAKHNHDFTEIDPTTGVLYSCTLFHKKAGRQLKDYISLIDQGVTVGDVLILSPDLIAD